MPSEPRPAAPADGGGRWEWLSSQGLGVVCGQATVLLLAVGSVVLAATRGGASAAIAMDDVRGFFNPPAPAHAWFYLLLPVLSLYALNTALATWKSVASKWRNGLRSPHVYAPAVVHVAFLTGLLAHLVGGLGGAELGQRVVGPSWSELGDGRQARVTNLDTENNRDGSTKQVRASLEVRDEGGAVSAAEVHYNGPLSRGLGSDLLLLIRPEPVAVVSLVRGSRSCEVAVEGSCDLSGVRAELLFLHPPRRTGDPPFARLRLANESDGAAETFWMLPGDSRQLADGSLLWLAEIDTRPGVRLRHRRAPGDPWALLASLLLATGLCMLWRRFARP